MSTLTWSIIALVVLVLVIVIAHNLWQGRRIIQAAIPPHQRAIEETFSVLTPEEQAQLVELLKKFKNV